MSRRSRGKLRGELLGRRHIARGEFPYYHEEVAELRAQHPGERIFDFSAGSDLMACTGLADIVLADFVARQNLANGLWKLVVGTEDGRRVMAYCYIRDKDRVDIGTRKDFEALGWKDFCDQIDARFPEGGQP